jgi:hypothetical protein
VWVDLNRNSIQDIGEPDDDSEIIITAITLDSFSARIENDHVVLSWRTGAEIDNAGFNLYRSSSADGLYTKINDLLIAGQGTGSGAGYSYVDEKPGGERYYKLEDIDYFGVSTFHGPIEAIDPAQIYLPNVQP